MRALPLLLLAIILLMTFSQVGQAVPDGTWGMTVSPSIAINNGDNVTFAVTGWGNSYVNLDVLAPETNFTVYHTSLITDDSGKGSVEWPVSIDQASGHYAVIVSDTTGNLTSSSVDVVYDRLTYDEYIMRQQTTQLEQQRGQLAIMGNYIVDVQGRLVFIYGAAFIMLIVCLYISYSWVHHMSPWKEWKAYKERYNRSNLRAGKRLFYKFLNPPADGLQTLEIPGLEVKMRRELKNIEKAKGPAIVDSFVVVTDPTANGGVRVFPLNDMPAEEPEEEEEAPEEPEEDEEEMKASKEQVKEAERHPQKEGILRRLSNLIHFRRRKKMARYAKLKYPMGPVDDDNDVDERPIPAPMEASADAKSPAHRNNHRNGRNMVKKPRTVNK